MTRAITKTNNYITEGSVADVARRENISLDEALMRAKHVALLDVSGSMTANDTMDGLSRHDVAEQELRKLQAKYPGDLALVCFSFNVRFIPAGIPERMNGGTDLVKGLDFIRGLDGFVEQIFIICDGYPDNPERALSLARTFKTPINAIYIGPADDHNGIQFMRLLAQSGKGKNVNADKIGELAEPFEKILLLAQGA